MGKIKKYKPTSYLINSIKKAEKNIKNGNVSPVFSNGLEAVAWLKKQKLKK